MRFKHLRHCAGSPRLPSPCACCCILRPPPSGLHSSGFGSARLLYEFAVAAAAVACRARAALRASRCATCTSCYLCGLRRLRLLPIFCLLLRVTLVRWFAPLYRFFFLRRFVLHGARQHSAYCTRCLRTSFCGLLPVCASPHGFCRARLPFYVS